MPTNLTAQFDFAGELPEQFAERIFRSAHGVGRIPSLLTRTFDLGGSPEGAEIYLSQPTLAFTHSPGLQNAARLEFPFILRLDSLDQETGGRMELVAPVQQEQIAGADGVPVRTFVVDFAQLGPASVHVSFEFTPPMAGLIQPALQAVLADLLRAQIVRLPISLSVRGSVLSLVGRVFHDPGFQPPLHQHYPEPDYLALFLNLDGRNMPVPGAYPPLLAHLVPVGGELQRSHDNVLAIPGDFFMTALGLGLQQAGLGSLPAPLPGDPSVTIEALRFELRTGHLYVEGRATKSIDVIPDPTADFSALLTALISGNQTVIQAHNVTVDLPAWAAALHFLLPFIGSIILAVIQRAIESLSGQTQVVPFQQFNFFADRILMSPDASVQRPQVNLRNTGGLGFRPDGVLMYSDVDLAYTAAPVAEPRYLRAHKGSKEFHRPGCRFGNLIKMVNLRRFIHERAALAAGYNGCATCAPEYDSHASANVNLAFRAPGYPPEQHAQVTVTYAMSLVSASGDVGSGDPQQHVGTFRNWVGPDGVYQAAHTFRGLVPGLWELTVASGSWSASCRRKAYGDRTRSLRFTLGQAGCVKA